MSEENKTLSKSENVNDFIVGVVRSYLKDNLKVKVEYNFDFSKRSCSNFDVIVELNGEEISKSDFEVNFPFS